MTTKAPQFGQRDTTQMNFMEAILEGLIDAFEKGVTVEAVALSGRNYMQFLHCRGHSGARTLEYIEPTGTDGTGIRREVTGSELSGPGCSVVVYAEAKHPAEFASLKAGENMKTVGTVALTRI